MAIDNIGGKPNINANNAANTNSAKSNAAQQQQANVQQQTQQVTTRPDSVVVSSTVQRAAQTASNNQSQDIDQRKIASIKKALNEGVYKVDAERLAAKIIAFEEAFDE